MSSISRSRAIIGAGRRFQRPASSGHWLAARSSDTMCIMHRSGRHFLQIPGPSNTPDRVLRAMAQPTIDHRSAEFAALGRTVLQGLQQVFQTEQPVVMFPSSGTGAWEASLVNTLSPGDGVLAFDIGEFSRGWAEVARRLGLEVELLDGRLAARRRSRAARGPIDRRPRASHLRGAGGPQRDVDRRHQPPAARFVMRSTRRAIRRCCWSTPSRRSVPLISVTTNGGSTSRWRGLRRA